MDFTKEVNTANEMMQFGRYIGGNITSGGICFILAGDVGAGKTTFTKGLAEGLNITETIQSPTFTINRQYEGRDSLLLSHYDFYRLPNAGIMAEVVAEAAQDPDTVVVIEWADVVTDVLPPDCVHVNFTPTSENSRTVTMHPKGARSKALIERAA